MESACDCRATLGVRCAPDTHVREQAMEKSIGLGEKGMERVPSLMETFNDIKN